MLLLTSGRITPGVDRSHRSYWSYNRSYGSYCFCSPRAGFPPGWIGPIGLMGPIIGPMGPIAFAHPGSRITPGVDRSHRSYGSYDRSYGSHCFCSPRAGLRPGWIGPIGLMGLMIGPICPIGPMPPPACAEAAAGGAGRHWSAKLQRRSYCSSDATRSRITGTWGSSFSAFSR